MAEGGHILARPDDLAMALAELLANVSRLSPALKGDLASL